MPRKNRSVIGDALQNAMFMGLLRLVLALPYAMRVRLMGWLAAHVLGPLAGWRKRIASNLAHVRPDLSAKEVEHLQRAVADNVGRTLVEIYSGAEFKKRVTGTPLEGPGADALRAARAKGRPVALVTAHLGNFDALRAILFAEGFELGAIYRPMNNPKFNEHWVATLSQIGTPLFPSTREGIPKFVRHLADGGIVGILTDLYKRDGAETTFFGKPAPSSAAACAWALKYDAEVIFCYGLRQPDGLSFRLILEEPIAHSNADTMTQEINDRLEAVVREHMDQWFWIHRRWKPERAEKEMRKRSEQAKQA
ncbi:Lipid A biosynthesis lauroyl acyltransferase [Rhodobacteraceae bacterium THAF1]|nr:Lipid A biosynthesis lauroyl acyltransferase [Palleronia sp. THAF1]VDC24263.1 Lipid A biosynthesis lauroyl acyltransferase [Rhodobacteraceae bacterium THAF1]